MCAGVSIPPPCLGFFLLLELSDNSFFRQPLLCEATEIGRALFILLNGRDAVPAVCDHVFDHGKTLEIEGEKALRKYGEKVAENYEKFVEWCIDTPFNGLAMIPGGEPCREQFFFNAVTVARLQYLGAKFGNLTPDAVLWDISLAALGHLIACGCDAEGQKGIGRPKDPEDIRRQLQAAKEREKRGEAQPWLN